MQPAKLITVSAGRAMLALSALTFIACGGAVVVPQSISYAGWIVDLPQKDRQAVLGLLRGSQFSQLNQLYEDLQLQYETGLINDRDLTLQYEAFYDTSPENVAFLNQWVEKNPKSYPARLARGIYYANVGKERRGGDFIRNIPTEKLHEFHRYLDLSNKDVADSIPLTAKPIVSILQLLKSSKHRDGKQANRMWLDYAVRIDPRNYGARRQYMLTLSPRWGGSYDEMWAFLKECQDQQLPSEYLKVLEARIYLDEAQMWCCEKNEPEKGVASYRKVVALLDGIDIKEKLDALKGIVGNRDKTQSLVAVAPEIEAILRISPDDSRILGYRGWIRFQQGRFQEGLKDYTTAAELGDAYSQLQLGRQLYYGMPPTVAPNREQALFWIKKSVDQGNEAAKQFMMQVEPKH
jgi:tetratricopeptide (TPR) repeat protein